MDKYINDVASALAARRGPATRSVLGGLYGLSNDEIRKQAAWARTRPLSVFIAASHPHDARIDELGNIICRSYYGRHDSNYGWEIDHAYPTALGGSDHFSNLRALKCNANRSLGGILSSYFKP